MMYKDQQMMSIIFIRAVTSPIHDNEQNRLSEIT